MKKYFATLLMITIMILPEAFSQKELISDSISMGNGYVFDAFYDFGKKEINMAERNEWDIAFATDVMSISVLANDASGIEVYTYNKANAEEGWANPDTSGMIRKLMYNSDTSWEIGAFVRNIIPGNEFDYGWGTYNMNNHKITGDSLFIMKLANDQWLKFMIVEKDAPNNSWVFKYANLDGSDESTVNLSANNYSTVHFVGYSFSSGLFMEHEPMKKDWDIVFTKYTAPIFMGPTAVPYPVAGVLCAPGIMIEEVRQSGMDQASFDAYNIDAFIDDRAGIGYDWKATEGMPPVYVVLDTIMYFIKDSDGSIFKMYFTGFESGTTGDGTFWFQHETLLDASSVDQLPDIQLLEVYPNPASTEANIALSSSKAGFYQIDILDLNGRIIKSEQLTLGSNELLTHKIALTGMEKGIYLIRFTAQKGQTYTHKLVVQ